MTPFVKAVVRWATGKRLTNRVPKLSLITAPKVARAGSFSRDCVPRRRATQDRGNPIILSFRSINIGTSHRPSSSQALPFETATGGLVRVCACVLSCFLSSYLVLVGNKNEHMLWYLGIPRAGQLIECCAADRYKPSSPPNFENNRAATLHTATTAVQQYLRLKHWPW